MSNMPQHLPKLLLGFSDFELIRRFNLLYLDRTDLIYELAKDPGTFFLSRPRRFGKSLLTSTLHSLFEHGITHFGGLKIAKLWHDETYPVTILIFQHSI